MKCMSMSPFYPQLNNFLECRLSRIKEIKDFFMEEINDSEKMSKALYKYTTSLDYV